MTRPPRLLRTALHAVARTIALCALPLLSLAAQARTTIQPLDSVSVVASRTGTSANGLLVDVISRADIEQSRATTLAQVLAGRLGVDLSPRSAAQADVSLRGASPEQTLILVDGIRVSDVQSAHYNLDIDVPVSDVERIEVLRGAASALYGPDAVGGVINIVTRRGGGRQASAWSGGTGLFGATVRSELSDAATVSADFQKSDGFRPGTDYRMGNARFATAMTTRFGEAQVDAAAGIRDFGANAFYGPYNSTERTGTASLHARWSARVGRWSSQFTASTRRHTDRFTLVRDQPQIYENLHTSWQSAVEYVARRPVGRGAVALGGEVFNAQLVSNRLGSQSEWRGAPFVEVSLPVAAEGVLTAGVRSDVGSAAYDALSPSLSLAVPLATRFTAQASVARGFRAPTWTERYYQDPSNIGTANLETERFVSANAGLVYRGADGLRVHASAFLRSATHLIDWVRPAGSPSGTPWTASNVGRAEFRGVEATAEFPDVRGVSVTANVSGLVFSDEQGSALVGKYALRPITRALTLRAASARRAPLRLSAEVVQAQRAFERGFVTMNAALEAGGAGVTWFARGDNLGGAAWLDGAGRAIEGRRLTLGVATNR